MMSVNEIFLSQNPNRLKKNRWQNAATPFFSLCSFLLIYVSTFGNASNAPSNAGYFNIDTITIASEPDYPPYCIVDENGNADGFAIELFLAAAKATGLNVKVKVGIWELIKNDLAAGKIDALPFVGRTPEREEVFDFSLPYLFFHGAVFVREKDSKIHSMEDLHGKEIVVMKGDNAEEFIRRENITDKIYTTNTFEEAFSRLAEGYYDAIIVQKITGIQLLKQLKIKTIKPLDFRLPRYRQDFCFAVQKGNEPLLSRLNEGLSIIIANDTFEEIRLKWFGPSEIKQVSTAHVIKIILIILLPVSIVLILLWIIFLRREVKRRTNSLQQEIWEHKQTLNALHIHQSQLKESEARIRLLLNSTAEGIYGIDQDGNCSLINKSALQILGFENRNQVVGKNIHNLIHHTRADGSPYPAESCNIFKTFKNGEKIHNSDEVFWRTDGTSFSTEYFSYPIIEDEKVTGAVVAFWDISERKKGEMELLKLKNELEAKVALRTKELQEKVVKLDKSQKAMLFMVEDLSNITVELKKERKKLEFSNKELEAFAYSVSHDLRAPLRAINGYSNFLLEDYAKLLDDEGKRFINTIRENATKMDQLISDMLNLSRVSRASLNLSEVNMASIVKSIYNETANEKEKKQFEFCLNQIPDAVCDYSLIKQVWQNLISNALKYSSKSAEKKIEIGAEKSNNEVIYYIKDKGAGFDSKYENKLFGVFQRLHKSSEFKGTGVGLAIVQRIIVRHEGRIWAESEVDKGAAFFFSLPDK